MVSLLPTPRFTASVTGGLDSTIMSRSKNLVSWRPILRASPSGTQSTRIWTSESGRARIRSARTGKSRGPSTRKRATENGANRPSSRLRKKTQASIRSGANTATRSRTKASSKRSGLSRTTPTKTTGSANRRKCRASTKRSLSST